MLTSKRIDTYMAHLHCRLTRIGLQATKSVFLMWFFKTSVLTQLHMTHKIYITYQNLNRNGKHIQQTHAWWNQTSFCLTIWRAHLWYITHYSSKCMEIFVKCDPLWSFYAWNYGQSYDIFICSESLFLLWKVENNLTKIFMRLLLQAYVIYSTSSSW